MEMSSLYFRYLGTLLRSACEKGDDCVRMVSDSR